MDGRMELNASFIRLLLLRAVFSLHLCLSVLSPPCGFAFCQIDLPGLLFFFFFFLPTCANHAIKSRQGLTWLFAARVFHAHLFLKGCKRMRVCVCVFYGRQLPPMCKKYIQSRTRVPETAEGSPLLRGDLSTHVPLLPKAFRSV